MKTLFYNMFNTDKEAMDSFLATARRRGAGFADLYYENCACFSMLLRDGTVSSVSSSVDCGVGIRALLGEKTGYAYCDSLEHKDIMQAAAAASAIACDSVVGGSLEIGHEDRICPGIRTDSSVDFDIPRFAESLQKLERLLKDADSRIDKVMGKLSCSNKYVLMYNSFGELSYDYRPMQSLSVGVVFSKNGTRDSRNLSRSFRTTDFLYTDALLKDLADDVLSGIDKALEAKKPKGGVMPVVMGAGASGILLHEAMGHAFEADFNRKRQSIFCDRMRQRICAPGINIVDDGTIAGNRGSLNVDDEGVPGQKTYMVRDGILNSYLHDKISAAFYGVQPTGNGRREDFRNLPIPRMRLTYMESGDADPSSIISSVKKGIFVDEFSNGEVKIGEGDFTFFVKSGNLIENGRLTTPVKDINIIGNGPQALADIRAVGNDLKIDDSCWTCGKGQSVAVGCGMPTVLVEKLTVGGE